MRVRLNGGDVDLAGDATVAEAVARLGVAEGERGVAAAVDGDVVPRASWARTPLREGATVEVVRAAAGG
ncbi:MAG TPA: sulfur carrier protein ThiS [Miltoncostaeaceae bacterium]|nr:sulfur carrier protein ThiS [Miltoncostaeaceae bacterium]